MQATVRFVQVHAHNVLDFVLLASLGCIAVVSLAFQLPNEAENQEFFRKSESIIWFLTGYAAEFQLLYWIETSIHVCMCLCSVRARARVHARFCARACSYTDGGLCTLGYVQVRARLHQSKAQLDSVWRDIVWRPCGVWHCQAVPRNTNAPCHPMPSHNIPCHALPPYTMPHYAAPPHPMPQIHPKSHPNTPT